MISASAAITQEITQASPRSKARLAGAFYLLTIVMSILAISFGDRCCWEAKST